MTIVRPCFIIAACCVAGAAQALSPILKELEDTYVALGERVRPAVVNIDATSRVA